MRRSRFNEGQIIGILKESEAGVPVTEFCRRHGISEQTFYRWKKKYGGLELSEARGSPEAGTFLASAARHSRSSVPQ